MIQLALLAIALITISNAAFAQTEKDQPIVVVNEPQVAEDGWQAGTLKTFPIGGGNPKIEKQEITASMSVGGSLNVGRARIIPRAGAGTITAVEFIIGGTRGSSTEISSGNGAIIMAEIEVVDLGTGIYAQYLRKLHPYAKLTFAGRSIEQGNLIPTWLGPFTIVISTTFPFATGGIDVVSTTTPLSGGPSDGYFELKSVKVGQ